jgi:hypothetical protein
LGAKGAFLFGAHWYAADRRGVNGQKQVQKQLIILATLGRI